MGSVRTVALILKAREYSETSLVIRGFSRDFGQFTALAKGARRLKHYRAGALDLLCCSEVTLRRRPRTGLDLLHEARLIREFFALGRPFVECLAGHVVAQVLLGLTFANVPEPRLFQAAMATVGEPTEPRLLQFLWDAVCALGHCPTLDRCAVCGIPMDHRPQSVRFCPVAGGILCERCPPVVLPGHRISRGALRALQLLAKGPSGSRRKLRFQGQIRVELWRLTADLVETLAARPLNALRTYLRQTGIGTAQGSTRRTALQTPPESDRLPNRAVRP